MVAKPCIRCGEHKALDEFHRHKRMADGRLNKCRSCVVEYVAEWRKRPENADARNREYLRGEGAKKRARGLKYAYGGGRNQDPEARRLASLKYANKRRLQEIERPTWQSELDEFAFSEARDLCRRREPVTGSEWHVDHIVPLNHRRASGLHNAFNLQAAPATWNIKKGNRHMATFLLPGVSA